jgi:hypothetical protein
LLKHDAPAQEWASPLKYGEPAVAPERGPGQASRIVAVIGPIKGPGQQINYGSGKDVSDETLADAGDPLEIRWLGGSYLELPVRR